jgi:Zn-dependent protease with chaperone function
MPIYVKQNDRQLGPLSIEQAQELVRWGGLPLSSPARAEGQDDWVPLATLLEQQAAPPRLDGAPAPPPRLGVPPATTLGLDRLRDPKEQTAFAWLWVAAGIGWLLLLLWTIASFGVVLLLVGLGLLLRLIGELWFAAYVKTNAVRISPTQLPELYQMARWCCQRLNMPVPDVYVMQQNTWNAFAAKILGRRMVVLLSGAMDSLLLKGDLREVAWVLGHELGHHRAGHLDLPRKLAAAGDWCIWLRLWYSRRAELTCDRIGLYCSGSLQHSQLALVNATVGAQLASQVNVAEAIQQWRQHQGEFFVKYRTFYAAHPHLLARLDHLTAAAAEFGLRA